MGFGLRCWSLYLHLLLVLVILLQYSQGGTAKEMTQRIGMKLGMDNNIAKRSSILRLHGVDAKQEIQTENVLAHPASHMHPIDPALMVFFTIEDLFVGKVMPIYFPHRKLSSLHLLPREEADSIPFSLHALPILLQRFSISHGSPQAIAMEDTLRQCKTKPIKGETKHCATSLESMNSFTRGILGLDTELEMMTTTHITSKSNTLLQNYTVLEIKQDILAPRLVACHTMPYAYAVFYCHSQESKNRVLKVILEGENGDSVEALSVCHLDTSQWSRNHVSFGVLGIDPGSSPVCHFFPADNFIWIPKTTLSST